MTQGRDKVGRCNRNKQKHPPKGGLVVPVTSPTSLQHHSSGLLTVRACRNCSLDLAVWQGPLFVGENNVNCQCFDRLPFTLATALTSLRKDTGVISPRLER